VASSPPVRGPPRGSSEEGIKVARNLLSGSPFSTPAAPGKVLGEVTAMTLTQGFNKQQLVALGEAIYQQRLQSELEPAHQGDIVAIEVESGEYFLGKSVVEAIKKARTRHPDKLFYLVRVGFPTVHVRR
jgi:hypothetical protein